MAKYCQTNEDQIINRIMKQIGVTTGLAVEFGGGDGFNLSNVRHLVALGWKIAQLDLDNKGNKDVLVECITAENINEIFTKHNLTDISLLSIDIDGNDYWVWKALVEQPKVVVIEWNPNVQGCKTIKYDPNHRFRHTDFYGATWDALKKLGESKGYTLVESNGLNMFFVRSDLVNKKVTINVKKPVVPRGWSQDNTGEWVDV